MHMDLLYNTVNVMSRTVPCSRHKHMYPPTTLDHNKATQLTPRLTGIAAKSGKALPVPRSG